MKSKLCMSTLNWQSSCQTLGQILGQPQRIPFLCSCGFDRSLYLSIVLNAVPCSTLLWICLPPYVFLCLLIVLDLVFLIRCRLYCMYVMRTQDYRSEKFTQTDSLWHYHSLSLPLCLWFYLFTLYSSFDPMPCHAIIPAINSPILLCVLWELHKISVK